MQKAKEIILTPIPEQDTDTRWGLETPYLTDLIVRQIHPQIQRDSIILDYGCGIGRLSKALIDSTGCSVVGVDISTSMRALAASYVNSSRFTIVHPELLDTLQVKFDHAITVWVLQHIFDPSTATNLINKWLKPNGELFVVNEVARFVPTISDGWINDGADVKDLLDDSMNPIIGGTMNAEIVTEAVASRTYWGIWQTKGI
jgi:2-polyprenyl-3-methyl-5-hydroxy-6-metoxy-1,4-benzoquinol methylase